MNLRFIFFKVSSSLMILSQSLQSLFRQYLERYRVSKQGITRFWSILQTVTMSQCKFDYSERGRVRKYFNTTFDPICQFLTITTWIKAIGHKDYITKTFHFYDSKMFSFFTMRFYFCYYNKACTYWVRFGTKIHLQFLQVVSEQ